MQARQRATKRKAGAPVCLSFDIDALDPAFAPGAGTPEIGGLAVMSGLEIVRGCLLAGLGAAA